MDSIIMINKIKCLATINKEKRSFKRIIITIGITIRINVSKNNKKWLRITTIRWIALIMILTYYLSRVIITSKR